MMKMKNNEIIIMNFSGIYGSESFYDGENVTWVEVQGLLGSNCYCDEEAMIQIREKIQEFSAEGIHFIDSGNYHYMSRIWLEKITQPFRLLVFDNHTDMQPPAFGGILSCGGWIADALEELPLLKEVVLCGPDEESFGQVPEEWTKKVRFLSREKCRVWRQDENASDAVMKFFSEIPTDLPLYVSVDKDVLCEEDACTTWSQGDMRLSELLEYLDHNEVDMICTIDDRVYDTNYIIANEEEIGVHFVASPENILAGKGEIKLEELVPQPFLLTEKGMSYRRLMDEKLARNSLEIQPVLETGRADLICALAEENAGIAFLPDYVTEESVKQGRLVWLNVPDCQVIVWKQLLYRREKWVSLQMQAMIDHLAVIRLTGPSEEEGGQP